MPLNTQPYKGARDFFPEDKRLQKYMFSVLRKTVEGFGYEEYDGPMLESLDLYTAKTGEEIVNEQTYTFTDRGDRQVVIRPEMTPTVSRMVAARRNLLTYPLRLYSIPNLWRYERSQRGRFREHWQLNIDLFGDASLNAEVEIISLADQIYQNFGADRSMYQVRLNSRKLMDQIADDYLGLSEDKALALIKLIDRKNKLEAQVFWDQVAKIIGNKDVCRKIEEILEAKNLDELNDRLKNTEAAQELSSLIDTLTADFNISNVVYDPTLMRGFDYYTDIVFEVFDNHPDNNRSMMGGGRYDGLVGLFDVAEVPTIGFGLGDATLQNFLEIHQLLPKLKVESDLAVLTIGDVNKQAQGLIKQLRDQGLNVVVESSDKKLGNKIKWAESKGLTYILVLGNSELNSNKLTIKNLISGDQVSLQAEEIVDYLKSNK